MLSFLIYSKLLFSMQYLHGFAYIVNIYISIRYKFTICMRQIHCKKIIETINIKNISFSKFNLV
jgi:hypothetical protein